MKPRAAGSLVLALVFTCALCAQAKMKYFPLWAEKEVEGTTFGCYTFEQMKEIMGIDAALQRDMAAYELIQKSLDDAEAAKKKLQDAQDILQALNEQYSTRLKEKQVELEKTTDDLVKAQESSVWSSLPWIITACVVILGAGFGIGWWASDEAQRAK